MICGSCGMRMDGAAVLACKVRMYEIAQAGKVPGHLGDGQPADRQGPRRRHGAVLGEVQQRRPVPAARLRRAAGRQGAPDHARADERRSTRSRSASTAAAASRSATRWSPTRTSPGRRRSPRRCASSATRATATSSSARGAERRARHLGLHPLLLLQRALPEGRRPARRDRQARRRVDEGGDRPRHGRQAREVVRHLREDDRLAARDRAGAEDAGRRRGDQADAVRARPGAPRQGAAAVPAARREGRQGVAPALRPRRASRACAGYAGIVQGEHALGRLAHAHGVGTESLEEIYARDGAFQRPFIPRGRQRRRPA